MSSLDSYGDRNSLARLFRHSNCWFHETDPVLALFHFISKKVRLLRWNEAADREWACAKEL